MEEVMNSSGLDVAEVHGILLAMQKNLECPICLEIMKEPVSTHCAHVFCSFCILKLLEQRKGITKCPLCNGNISKSTLQEDVRYKLVIKAVLEAIGALEFDTGFSFLGDRCFHKKSAVLQEKQIVIESKGYHGRLNGVKKVEKRNSTLQNKSSHLPLPNRAVTRHSLMKKSSSDNTVCFEIGSDSSEDLFQKTATVRWVGWRNSSQSQDGERHAEKRSQSPCHVELQEPNGKDVVLLGTPGACGLSEAGRDSTGGTRASPGNRDAVSENVEKRQNLSSPVPGIERHRGQPVSDSAQENGSYSLPSMERSQLVIEATDPAPNKQIGSKVEMVSKVQPAESGHLYDHICEDEQELQQPHASPKSPLGQAYGEKLNQSIQKVNEWFSKSKILSPAPSQDINTEESDPDLNPYPSNGDCHIFQETELMEDQWEVAAGCEFYRPVSKPVASRIVDKIFGRTYIRRPKSDRIRIPVEESCTAANAKSCDALIRKIPAHKKARLQLTPEGVTKKRTAKEYSKGADGNANAISEEDGCGFAVVDGAPEAVQRPVELSVKEGASGFELDASPVGRHLRSLQNLKKPRNSLSKRSQRPGEPVCPLQLVLEGRPGSPEKVQADGNPNSEGSQEGTADQVHIRRSRRLLSRAKGEQWESEPTEKRRKRLNEGEKKQKETRAGNASPSSAGGSPSALQGRQMVMAEDASKDCVFPDGEGSLGVECQTERCSPCPIVSDATSQSRWLLLQGHFAEREQSDRKVKEFTAVPQAEQSAMCAQAPEINGFCLRDVKESCKSPRVCDRATGKLNTETDDSELDAGLMRQIFHCCKRQSFLLHPVPSKKPAAGIQAELSIGWVEGSEADYAKKSTPGIASVSKVRREAVSSNELIHLQVASQADFLNSLYMPATVKEAESGILLQSPKPACNKKEFSEMDSETSNANDCSRGSSGLWRRGDFQGTGLYPTDETSSKTTQFLEMRPESDRNKAKSGTGSVESKGGVGEQTQLKGTREQTVQMSSAGVSEGHSEQSPKDENPGFAPESLLGSATKSSFNLWEVDQQDTLAMFAKNDQGSPLEKDLECGSSSGSRPESLAQTHRGRAQKLSSTEEEDFSEDEELPCFQALAFGQSASTPSQPMKEASAEIPPQSSSSRSRGKDGSPSQESEGSVNLFSSQSHASEDSTSKPRDTRLLTPVPTFQGKAMTPRTAIEPLDEISGDAGQLQDRHQDDINAEPNLGEALGYDSEISHLGDSPDFSQSEILTTQQKDAIQNNLKKLQQEMAVLQAALKEGSQDVATERLLLPGEESISAEGKMSSARGSASQMRCGSRQSLLTASPPAGSTHRTSDDCLTSSSTSQERMSYYPAAEPEKGSAVAVQDVPSAPEHESQGRPVSSFAPTAICSGRKKKSKSLSSTSKRSMTLVASGLCRDELRLVQKFARKTKSIWSNTITKDTTHVIMKTDEDLVCERTLKYFLGIAARKWVMSYLWVLQSLKEGSVLNEGDFEVRGDIINGRNHQGPRRARESPTGKLFQGLEICCYGPFTDMQREQLEWMVELCGASLVKQPHLFSCSTNSAEAVVVIQPDAWEEDSGCQGIPPHCSATVVAREWVLDSVACYQRMAFDDYILRQT
ncbi:breast cancer type 1 susceptibility protein [Heteronotia binoei]|uniref:breast cancer type 1 susceptibility protein n=1 Tax=Heteronotia binoei TaxID=13085 RepID=UPI0029307D5B|nr:breast cancer type 1 susceptibility protein [Heteronotia binoei]